jgi:hypothetical protein
MQATDIFVNLPTADDPTKRVSLQDAIVLFVCEIQDLKARFGEMERWPALTDEEERLRGCRAKTGAS